MSDLSLNNQLGARLKAISESWQHDNPSETLAVILDGMIHKWTIAPPQIPQTLYDYPCRVRLKSRHLEYFTQMSEITGASATNLARSLLVQWLMSANTTQMSTQLTQISTQITHTARNKTRKKPKKPQATNDKTQDTQIKETTLVETAHQSQEETTNRTNARASLSSLMD
ncbi:MAG: hypothetical protein AAFY76_02330 [Cyanobacteria bacterium J06649_11]